MQAEIQEKRGWITKQDFVEGLALVNMLPGPGAAQLGIFLGHAKGGLVGGTLAGIAFILPAFLIMLALSAAYDALGALAVARHAFYGIGPVVVGIFAAAVSIGSAEPPSVCAFRSSSALPPRCSC